MKLLFCTKTGCSPYHWPLFLGYPWLVAFRQLFPSPPPPEGGKKKRVWDIVLMERIWTRTKIKGPGTGGVIVVKWKSSRTQSGKRCLKVVVLHGSAVHFEGKHSWKLEFFMFCFAFFSQYTDRQTECFNDPFWCSARDVVKSGFRTGTWKDVASLMSRQWVGNKH